MALITNPKFRAFDLNGVPLAGGLVNTYVGGTSTRLATYTTSALAVANANPVVLDANGEASIYGLNDTAYKVVLTDALGVVQWTEDNVVFASGDVSASMALTAVNWIDNGGAEVYNIPLGRSAVSIGATTTAVCVFDRWWAYRGGVADYTVIAASLGYPRFIQMQRTAATANTTSITIGQHTGYSGDDIRSPYEIIHRALNAPVGLTSLVLVASAYILKGANFSGTGVTLEIVTNAFDNNIHATAGNAWIVDASATLTAEQLSTTTLVRISVSTTTLTANQSALGLRIRFDAPSGTAGAADWIRVTGVKLELGASGTPTRYEIPTMDESISRCQRFYRQFGSLGAPFQVSGYGAASQNFDLPFALSPTMMKTPTATVNGTWTVVNCGQPTIESENRHGFIARTVVTATGEFSYIPDAGDTLTFDAETP